MALTITVTPGYEFSSTEAIDNDKLNQLGQPAVVVTGTAADSDIGLYSIAANKVKVGAWFFATSATFASSDYALVFPQGTVTPVDGMLIAFKADVANTGATTLTVSGNTKPLRKFYSTALAANDILAGQIVEARYDATNAWWQLLTPTPISGSPWVRFPASSSTDYALPALSNSVDQDISTSTLPKVLVPYLRATETDAATGYNVNDILLLQRINTGGGGVTFWLDSGPVVRVRFTMGVAFTVYHKASGASMTGTPSKFKWFCQYQ